MTMRQSCSSVESEQGDWRLLELIAAQFCCGPPSIPTFPSFFYYFEHCSSFQQATLAVVYGCSVLIWNDLNSLPVGRICRGNVGPLSNPRRLGILSCFSALFSAIIFLGSLHYSLRP